jgi:quercetin dioxygenase-like cupin family protein
MCASETGSGRAVGTVQVDEADVRVTRWDFHPGDATGWHRHELPYVIVPVLDGVLKIVDAAGERLVPLSAGVSYSRPAGVEHDVINAGEGPIAFVEVEMKG